MISGEASAFYLPFISLCYFFIRRVLTFFGGVVYFANAKGIFEKEYGDIKLSY